MTPPKGPTGGPAPLRTAQQMEEGKQARLEGDDQAHLFDLQLHWPSAFPPYIQTDHTCEAVGHSHLYNLTLPRLSFVNKSPSGPWICTQTTPSMRLGSRKMIVFVCVATGLIAYEILVPQPGVCTPLQWKCGIPAPGLPGNPRNDYFIILLLS